MIGKRYKLNDPYPIDDPWPKQVEVVLASDYDALRLAFVIVSVVLVSLIGFLLLIS